MNEDKKEFIRTSIVVFLWLVALLFIFISPIVIVIFSYHIGDPNIGLFSFILFYIAYVCFFDAFMNKKSVKVPLAILVVILIVYGKSFVSLIVIFYQILIDFMNS
ncbi:hypothetical protein [Pasteurella canis]|uniref:hypothetical protein n=1 Tax=Pasteurella canis TaxID=753 RepID=UPI001CBB1334|nr:hypothetical protein [Pasteurella canis]UAX42758.1 hypothetical protein K7G89_000603 [Pasteurella canis]